MDPDHIKRVAWVLCVGAGVLGAVSTLPALVGRVRRVPGAVSNGLLTVAGALLVTIGAGLVGFRLDAGSGHRGCALALGIAVLVAPLATLVGAWCVDGAERSEAPGSPKGDEVSSAWSLIPGVFLMGLALFQIGWFAHRYGVNARLQWQFWTLGMTVGLVWSVLMQQATHLWKGFQSPSGSVSGAGLMAVALAWALQMADYHFSASSTSPWFVIFCGVGILAGWLLSMVVAAMLTVNRATVLCTAAIMALAVGAVAGSAQAYIVREDNLLATVACGFLAALLLLALAGDSSRPAPDGLTLSIVALVLAGLAWAGFKLMMGLGVAVAALGFLAAWPTASALEMTTPSGRLGSQRFIELAGTFLVLLSGLKVFQEVANLMQSGVDIAEGNVMAALVCGTALAVQLEAIFGRSPSIEQPIRGAKVLLDALARALGVVGIESLAIVGVALFAGLEGVAALIIGLALWTLLTATSTAASGGEGSPATFRSMPAGLLTISLALALAPLNGLLTHVTRAQKMEMAIAVACVAVVAIGVGAWWKRWTRGVSPLKAEEAPEERKLRNEG